MTDDQIRSEVLAALGTVAPEEDSITIDPRMPLRDQLDIDSMDFLNFLIALRKRVGVEVREADYPKVATLEGCVNYVQSTLTPKA
jgi:acyl carrier protein